MVIVALFASYFVRLWCFGSADGIIMQQGSTNSDLPEAIVLANGLPVIAGRTYGDFPGMSSTGSGADAIVVKYNLDGTQAAITKIATTADTDHDDFLGSTIDDSANIYLVGRTTGDLYGRPEYQRSDVIIVKVDSNLNQVWGVQTSATAAHTTSEGGHDFAYAVALDSSGKVIVGGFSGGTWPGQTWLGSYDAFIMQYDSNGNRPGIIKLPIWGE